MRRKFLLLLLVVLLPPMLVKSQSVRPVKDSIGFCWNAEEMNRFVEFLDRRAKPQKKIQQNMVAAISVHDDYLYAGDIYYPLYTNIHAKEVVIFGVTHGTVRKEMGALQNILILDEYDEWAGVYSNVKISPLRELIKAKLDKENYIVSNKAHGIEHSIEALVPFLQYYNRNVKITPIMVTQMPLEKMSELSAKLAAIINEYADANNLKPGKDIFFLISNDANHYGEDFNNSPFGLDLKAHKTATENDKRIIETNLQKEIDFAAVKKLTSEILPNTELKKSIPLWCGRYPITLGLLTVENVFGRLNEKIEGKLLRYSDSLTEKVLPFSNTSMGLTAVFSPKHWCGWFTMGFYQRKNLK
ncbi:MAG: AmmeMemoRadiSam system protein B [Ignavibacteriales bacterium]|nr:AmmeMemoRadiSam system protein B [Ignavibacteriales bacterium]